MEKQDRPPLWQKHFFILIRELGANINRKISALDFIKINCNEIFFINVMIADVMFPYRL